MKTDKKSNNFNDNVKCDGKFRCPICGEELIWSSDENAYDVFMDRPEDDSSIVMSYSCQNCGANVECVECSDEDKKFYPFWETNK